MIFFSTAASTGSEASDSRNPFLNSPLGILIPSTSLYPRCSSTILARWGNGSDSGVEPHSSLVWSFHSAYRITASRRHRPFCLFWCLFKDTGGFSLQSENAAFEGNKIYWRNDAHIEGQQWCHRGIMILGNCFCKVQHFFKLTCVSVEYCIQVCRFCTSTRCPK